MNWDEYFFEMISLIAKKSKDPSSKIGCVIVGPDNEVRSTGYNGFPRGIKDDIEEVPERYERPAKYDWTEHSERNAVYNAARVGIPLAGCKIYLDWIPCPDCASAIIQSGIKEVIVDGNSNKMQDEGANERWKGKLKFAQWLLYEAKVKLRIVK